MTNIYKCINRLGGLSISIFMLACYVKAAEPASRYCPFVFEKKHAILTQSYNEKRKIYTIFLFFKYQGDLPLDYSKNDLKVYAALREKNNEGTATYYPPFSPEIIFPTGGYFIPGEYFAVMFCLLRPISFSSEYYRCTVHFFKKYTFSEDIELKY